MLSASRDTFAAACEELEQRVEKRRKRYLRWFYANAALAAFLLVAGLGFPKTIMQALVNAVHRANPASFAEILALSFFCSAAAALALALPLLRYHGIGRNSVPFEKRVWQEICRMIGNCHPASVAASYAHLARETGLFPEDAGISERPGLRGEVNGMSFMLQEMTATSNSGAGERCIFRGLFISTQPVQLRGGLIAPLSEKRALLLHRDYVNQEQLASLGWEAVKTLEMEIAFTPYIRAFSTHAEIKGLPADGQTWETLQDCVLQAQEVKTTRGIDLRLLQGSGSLKDFMQQRREKPALASELAYARNFCKPVPVHQAVQGGDNAFNLLFGAAKIRDTLLVAVPCRGNLFGPRSLFCKTDLKSASMLVFDVIAWIETLPQVVG